MKVKAIYNNDKPWLTLYPETDLDKKLLEDMRSPWKYRPSNGGCTFYGSVLTSINIDFRKPRTKPLSQRIKEVFKPVAV